MFFKGPKTDKEDSRENWSSKKVPLLFPFFVWNKPQLLPGEEQQQNNLFTCCWVDFWQVPFVSYVFIRGTLTSKQEGRMCSQCEKRTSNSESKTYSQRLLGKQSKNNSSKKQNQDNTGNLDKSRNFLRKTETGKKTCALRDGRYLLGLSQVEQLCGNLKTGKQTKMHKKNPKQ